MNESSNLKTKDLKLSTLSQHELSIEELTSQVNKVQKIMEAVMIEDTHFGTIPGTTKPTLYKAGADKINLVFRLSPTFEKEIIEHDEPGQREYSFCCTLTHLPTGLVFAEGYGSCSTLESKYRYRWDNTEQKVPGKYWESRDADLIGGSSFAARKAWVDGKQSWYIFRKIEITDPADYYNTCLKMGKKRALVDATLAATAASDIFTQDLDDNLDLPTEQSQAKKKNARPNVKSPEPKDKNKELINNICDEIMKLAENDIEKAPPILLKFTTFEGKNGEIINGTSDTADLYNYSAKRLGVLHGKLKKEIEAKGKSIGDENAKPPNE